MKAAVIRSLDHPPRCESFLDPVAEDGEILVHVRAAAVHPVVKAMANGTHYGSYAHLPAVAGLDGAGRLEDGTRVYFGTLRRPFGSIAEIAVASKSFCVPIPGALDDATAAAIVNPGMSSWLALKLRAAMVEGETVLVLGATGAAGGLAVRIAKLLGAKRVIAAGRNSTILEQLRGAGADEIVSLEQPVEPLIQAVRAAFAGGIDIVLDYLWGGPAECVLEALTTKGIGHGSKRVRLVQVGNSAGLKISLAAASLRSSGLELIGSGAGSVRIERVAEELASLLDASARHNFRVDTEVVPLSQVEGAWNRDYAGKRLVIEIAPN